VLADQVKLVRVAGKEGEQVYIQIGDDEMEMLTQQQAEQVSCLYQHTTVKRYLCDVLSLFTKHCHYFTFRHFPYRN